MKVLIVEDDEITATMIAKALNAHNYIVNKVTNGQEVLQLVQKFEYDLIVLDIMLPELDGISVCRQLRSQNYQIPIMLLTAKDSNLDKVMGLNAGADDYMIKPFNISELIARIHALLRRPQGSGVANVLTWGKLQLEYNNSIVTYDGKFLRLTTKEYQLLELFLRNPHRIFSRSAILEHLWSSPEYPGEDAVKTHIKGLRQKLKAVGVCADFIETIYGFGYRLKSLSENENAMSASISSQPTETSRQQAECQLVASLTKLWERYKKSFIEEVALLLQVSHALAAGTVEAKIQQQAKQVAHKLAGALGSFGFTEGSRLAREIEKLLQIAKLDQVQVKSLLDLVSFLQQELENSPTTNSPSIVCEVQYASILIVDDDVELIDKINLEATAWGFQVDAVTTLSAAKQAIASNPPDIILLGLKFADSAETGLTFLAEIREQNTDIPVIVLTGQGSLSDRLAVARLGGQAFVNKSLCANEILNVAYQKLSHQKPPEARLMVVDDDPTVLTAVSMLLSPWGLHVTTLSEPQKFWQVLETSVPDMLILDIKMPDFNGIELCQVVRNDPQWSLLPILCLSAHQDQETVYQVFTAGADDYIQKPIIGPELIARIFNRLERTKMLRELSEIDPLTGVTNRRKSIQQLNNLLYLAERQNQPFCFVILDLDHLKYINDQYGYDVGDRVLSSMGKLLRHSFRLSDEIARWGGEEFILGLYGVQREQGVKLLTRFLTIWNQQEFTDANSRKFHVTLSVGVAEYPTDGADLQALYRAADNAVSQAKTMGKNQVLGAE
ncbi:MAG: response regulator [Scytonema sp. PMC 1069.18]|nr:response regulator [Scytonema sp. PMC 1069.18]MEC4880536.1 response regulator [Scytonema sp. PMC 1070.18]